MIFFGETSLRRAVQSLADTGRFEGPAALARSWRSKSRLSRFQPVVVQVQ
jgi:hypothetical protein